MTQSTLFVCVLCRFSNSGSTSDPPSGQVLFDQLNEAISSSNTAIVLQPVRCMAACRSACVAAFAAPGKLIFMLSSLSAGSVPDLLQFSEQYANSTGGKVPYKERPETIKTNLHAVLPPLLNDRTQ
ncbi:DUF1636 domain-containing protein [Pseudanabaenaceae cyanobacterium LEGE 13415]|nr:DUF1636 domain-containing protein [Pseudanabaenaceae cyanobacterium LEGE 13415]